MGSLVIGMLVGALVLVVMAVVVDVRRRERRLARERAAVEAELARSQASVARLTVQVEALAMQLTEVRTALQDARARQPEYVITSLSHATVTGQAPPAPAVPALLAPRTTAAGHLEEQLVGALARQQDVSPFRAHVVELVVKTVALGHGVRRALSPDVLDRAAAESHVARRRSRRNRKREEREAKRLLRAVKEQRAA